MQGYIDVIVKDDKIEVMGQEFLLGELTVSLMNADDKVLREMCRHLVELERLAEICREKHIFYRKMINTDDRRRLELAGDEQIKIPTFDEWVEIHRSVCLIHELMQNFKLGEVLVTPVEAGLVKQFEGLQYDTEEYRSAWIWYLELLDITMGFVEDIIAVVRTFRAFTDIIIPGLKKYDTHHLSAAYSMLLFDERCKGMVASMDDPDKVTYTMTDYMMLQYIPMKQGDSFIIAEYFRMDNLQAVVKTDMLRGLMKGHFPKRCENCGRYFLMTRGYRTRFCDMPSPDDPKRTCAQIAYKKSRAKEKSDDNPKTQSYFRCRNRILRHFQRGKITSEQRDLLLRTAKDMLDTALLSPRLTNKELDEQLQSEQLYARCGIELPKRGRPKGS
ncbi:DUF6076 domain-containing protein [Ruminococcus sp.]|uniref:DUF6076 domain-containing protein n=1 Tax=Ruminococcus sp. TaxID=41978 RepID=UPI001B125743|nr:DUF6076 domain-containing protein [Ruminococcus sp.]MBO5557242.1 hypothetical protein [Ruminococcus sp.]